MRTLSYDAYLDKVYGCFLGKAVVGTMGAPFEGVKMPMANPYDPKMIEAMLPNDDLDLQILWLDVCEAKGPNFTSADLLERFCEHCTYSPGEYAVMRRNYEKRIMPPLSGKFGNDNYIEGMGCPIRSEIWACLAPGDMRLAAEFAGRDGCLDHEGASIDAERFFAALEAEAFFESDPVTLIEKARVMLPKGSKLDRLLDDTLALCAKFSDVQTIFRKIHRAYGHPDCTNMYQNFGIIIATLLKCDLDFIETGMAALNCGFDTDCTCATVGAIIGCIRGAKDLIASYHLGDVKYVLSVDAVPRGDRIETLSQVIAKLGAAFLPLCASETTLTGAPDADFRFEEAAPYAATFTYENNDPTVAFGETRRVTAHIVNRTARAARFGVSVACPEGFCVQCETDLRAPAFSEATLLMDVTFGADNRCLWEKNIFALTLKENGETALRAEFGVSGDAAWKVIGPFWETQPSLAPDGLIGKKSYFELFGKMNSDAEMNDRVRQFHLNYHANIDTDFADEQELFAPIKDDALEESVFYQKEDAIRMSDLFGMQGSCVAYLARTLVAPEDMTVCAQIGHSSPYRFWVNGELLSRRDECDWWTNENAHVTGVKLHKGENRIVIRLTRVNEDAKISLVFSHAASCSEYYPCFATRNPATY